jgi:hypothetical protein
MQQLLSNVMRNGDSVLRISALEVSFRRGTDIGTAGPDSGTFLLLPHGVDFADALSEGLET